MALEFKNEPFVSFVDRGGLSITGLRFADCTFQNCVLASDRDVRRRSVFRDIELSRCRVNCGLIGPAIFEDVTVSNLATGDPLHLWGALFNRVKISGRVGSLKLNAVVDPMNRGETVQGPFDRDRLKFYAGVDWAIDISEARFTAFDCSGIPARLIQRDPGSQAVVRRTTALDPRWQKRISGSNRLWAFAVDSFLNDGREDMVLVVPLAAAKERRKRLLDDFAELRKAGAVEPD